MFPLNGSLKKLCRCYTDESVFSLALLRESCTISLSMLPWHLQHQGDLSCDGHIELASEQILYFQDKFVYIPVLFLHISKSLSTLNPGFSKFSGISFCTLTTQ